MSNSTKMQFGFGSDSGVKEENVQSPVEEKVVPQTAVNESTVDESLNEEYVDKRSVTIALVRNESLYRKANSRALAARRDYIGSSVNSSRTLSSRKDEIEAYLPSIIGVAPNDPNFMTRVKNYFNNIQIPIDELGKTFDTSFIYNKKKDYLNIVKKEQAIEDKYQSVGKNNQRLLKEALKVKLYELDLLESTKHKFGRPVNVEDYLMYRHCLLYNDVCKEMSLINSDPSIRFYFKDDQKEKEKLRKFRLEANTAKRNFVACISDNTLFDAVYIQYCITKGLPIISSLAEDSIVKEQNLDKFSSEDPVKFNKIYNDKDIRLKATIEQLIARGELIRLSHNQNIMTNEGVFLGQNMNEVVAWFNNPENGNIVNAYYNKLKNI